MKPEEKEDDGLYGVIEPCGSYYFEYSVTLRNKDGYRVGEQGFANWIWTAELKAKWMLFRYRRKARKSDRVDSVYIVVK